MGAKQSIINLNRLASACSGRRSLVDSLAIAAFVLAASSITLRAQREIRVPLHAFMPPDFPASVNAVIPTPRFLPSGFELWRTYKDPDDGFGTGDAEVEVQYRDPQCWARKIRCRLQLFVSPMTQKPFSGTTGRSPEPLSLRIGSRTIGARYFAGIGPDSHETGNFNALVFPLDDLMIGIRSTSQGGVGRAELIKVAESLTYAAR